MKKTALALAAMMVLLGGRGLASDRQGTFEIIYGRYTVNDARFAKIYASSGSIEGLALTAALFFHLDFYLEAKVFSQAGQLTYTKEQTKFVLVPFSFGIRWGVPLGILEPFIGAGLDYYVYYESNVIGTAVDYAQGEHVMGGLRLNFGKDIPLSLSGRVKYTSLKATRGGFTVDLGGVEISGGLAFVF
ncbi:MAG: hypothetical protein ABSA30_06920 [Candidatus Aminicenantales bacterium]|jgi:hypothetical protein